MALTTTACTISCCSKYTATHGPLTRYAKLRVAHASGMPGTFSPPPWVSDPDMHPGTCVTHVPWCMPGSLASGFLWSRWWEKRSRHSQCMRNPQLYALGKRPVEDRVPADVIYSPWFKWVATTGIKCLVTMILFPAMASRVTCPSHRTSIAESVPMSWRHPDL